MPSPTVPREVSPPPPIGPLGARERDLSLDIIRGMAVFGLLWVNAQGGAGTTWLPDKVASWVMFVFAAGKFWTLFSILFGVTLAMQLARAGATGQRLAGRWLWRMVILFGIGLANAILFWPGDILRWYAAAGALLLLFHRLSSRGLLVAAAVVWLLGVNGQDSSLLIARAVGRAESVVDARQQETARRDASLAQNQRARNARTYLATVRDQAAFQRTLLTRRVSGLAGPLDLVTHSYFALFLIGLYIGRRRLLQDVVRHTTVLRAMRNGGLLLGVALSIVVWSPGLVGSWTSAAIPGTGTTIGGVMRMTSFLLLGLGYLAGLSLVLDRPGWQRRLSWVAPAGRLGLTNYVAQGAFLMVTRAGFGLGLQGRLGSLTWTGIAIVFFGVQVAYSRWWLSRAQYGPLEWVWRRLSYWRRPSAFATVATAR